LSIHTRMDIQKGIETDTEMVIGTMIGVLVIEDGMPTIEPTILGFMTLGILTTIDIIRTGTDQDLDGAWVGVIEVAGI